MPRTMQKSQKPRQKPRTARGVKKSSEQSLVKNAAARQVQRQGVGLAFVLEGVDRSQPQDWLVFGRHRILTMFDAVIDGEVRTVGNVGIARPVDGFVEVVPLWNFDFNKTPVCPRPAGKIVTEKAVELPQGHLSVRQIPCGLEVYIGRSAIDINAITYRHHTPYCVVLDAAFDKETYWHRSVAVDTSLHLGDLVYCGTVAEGERLCAIKGGVDVVYPEKRKGRKEYDMESSGLVDRFGLEPFFLTEESCSLWKLAEEVNNKLTIAEYEPVASAEDWAPVLYGEFPDELPDDVYQEILDSRGAAGDLAETVFHIRPSDMRDTASAISSIAEIWPSIALRSPFRSGGTQMLPHKVANALAEYQCVRKNANGEEELSWAMRLDKCEPYFMSQVGYSLPIVLPPTRCDIRDEVRIGYFRVSHKLRSHG